GARYGAVGEASSQLRASRPLVRTGAWHGADQSDDRARPFHACAPRTIPSGLPAAQGNAHLRGHCRKIGTQVPKTSWFGNPYREDRFKRKNLTWSNSLHATPWALEKAQPSPTRLPNLL